MKHLIRSTMATLCLASAAFAVPALAHAAEGYVTGNVNLRAGPDSSYPLIDLIPAGTGVDVQGCTEGWEWCDVIVYGNRGWVAGNYVEYEYQNRPVLLPAYGARIGIPIITFRIGNYWDNYYRSRPFYRQRTHWYHRPVVRRPPPPPMRHPHRPWMHGAPGHGRPPVNRPRPPATHRPRPSRPAAPGHTTRPPTQGHRPAPNVRPHPARPGGSQRPHVTSPPARAAARPVRQTRPQTNRSVPTSHHEQPARRAARPAQQTRPQTNRPVPTSGRAQPARSDHGKTRPANKKDDRRGH